MNTDKRKIYESEKRAKINARQSAYREKTKDKQKQYYQTRKIKYGSKLVSDTKKWKMENKDKHRSHNLKYHFGMTLDDYNKKLSEQNGCCAICGEHESKFKSKLAVDHCHKTGKIRGLLCGTCNPGLGYAKDSIDRLFDMINYLLKYGHGVG